MVCTFPRTSRHRTARTGRIRGQLDSGTITIDSKKLQLSVFLQNAHYIQLREGVLDPKQAQKDTGNRPFSIELLDAFADYALLSTLTGRLFAE